MTSLLLFKDRIKVSIIHRWSHSIEIPLRNHTEPLIISTGKYAKLSDGVSVATLGSTSVMTTAVSKGKSSFSGFVPLTVDYRQKYAAAGRIPTNFLRRELGPSEKEILTSRVIDRALRPLFPKGFNLETQLVCNLLAVDGHNDPDVLAINAASAALTLSDIPWNGPIGAVRVGMVNSVLLINPTRQQQSQSDLNLVLAGTRNHLTLMIEAQCHLVDVPKFLDAVSFGLEECSIIAKKIQDFKDSYVCSKDKRPFQTSNYPTHFDSVSRFMESLCSTKLRNIFLEKHDKLSRDKAMFALRDSAILDLKDSYPSFPHDVLHEIFTTINRRVFQDLCLFEHKRVDGRSFKELRPISCEVNLHKPLHGSALFQRGQTQVFCTVALDSLQSALKTDPMSVLTGAVKEKNFFLHYEFPPYATNDIGRSSSLGRREMGHGALAEKSLRPVIPIHFPFTIRLSSEVLESNGSSSMATICGGSLALMDAGVPLNQPVAGVAMGLISNDKLEKYQILTDITGQEDFTGNMDFKIAGTNNGITALQADIKIPGLPFHIVKEATERGHEAINEILVKMESCISSPRVYKSNWPVTETITVPNNKRSKLLGQGGINLRRITSATGVQLTCENDSLWSLFATNQEAMSEAKSIIEELLKDERDVELTFGAIYPVTIVEVGSKGVSVTLHPALSPVFIPNSQLAQRKIHDPSVEGMNVGKEIHVKYYGRDPSSGAIRLSRKALLVAQASAANVIRKSTST